MDLFNSICDFKVVKNFAEGKPESLYMKEHGKRNAQNRRMVKMRGDSDNRLSADLALMKREADKYLKERKVYYIVAKEKLYFNIWRYEVRAVVSHEIKGGKIIAQSAFWGFDECDVATSKIFKNEKEAKKYKHRQNCLEVLFNEPENRESITWKAEFEKWLPDMLPFWR